MNTSAGARSQLAALVTVTVALAVLLFLAPAVARMPQATLAAIVVVMSLPLLSPRELRSIHRIRRMEFVWALIACVGVVFLGTLRGILVAVATSVVTLIHQANRPPVYALGRKPGTDVFRPRSPQHPEDETLPGLLIARTEGRMTFANAAQVGEHLWALIHEAKPRVVLLDCSAIPDFEYTAIKGLASMEQNLRAAGITLWLAALNPEPLRVLERAPLGETLQHERMFFNVHQAVERYRVLPQAGEATIRP